MYYAFVAIGACLGLLLGWEESGYGEDRRYRGGSPLFTKYALIFVYGITIASYTETTRGFLVVFLSSLGAFYLIKPIGCMLEQYWTKYRKISPNVRSLDYRNTQRVKHFSLDTFDRPASVVESVHLLSDGQERPQLVAIGSEGQTIEMDHFGNLSGPRMSLDRNGSVDLELTVDNWPQVSTVRFFGRWANGVYWMVDVPTREGLA